MGERGWLIVFEGIDGVGKSTQANALAEALEARGYDVVRSREPTDGPWGRRLRQSQAEGRLAPEEELDLFLRDRREHVETLIQPSLAAGRIVILDRYYFSTIAYQGARGFDPEDLRARNEAFAPPPDLLIILDLPAEAGLRRIQEKRGATLDSFETPTLLARSRQIFLDLAMHLPYARRVDAGDDLATIRAEVLALVDGLLNAEGEPPHGAPPSQEPI